MLLGPRSWFNYAILGAVFAVGACSIAKAQDGVDFNEAERMLDLDMVDLQDQLYSGLRLTTSEQRQFIQTVMTAVRQQRIPRAMVNVVYVWSRQKNAKYPFIYFQIAIRTLASRRGVDL